MNVAEFVTAIQGLISTTLESQKEIRDNYDMGLITFHEYMGQMDSLSVAYNNFINSKAMDTADQAGVSLDYLRGWCAHYSITF